jgi:hypothetical protein
VRDVIVGGQVVVRDGQCTLVDEPALHQHAQGASRDLLARAGLSTPMKWPVVDHRPTALTNSLKEGT